MIDNHMVAARKNTLLLHKSNQLTSTPLRKHICIVTEMEIATR